MEATKPRRLLDVKRDMEALKQERDSEKAHDRADELLIEMSYILLEKATITKNRQRQLVDQIVNAYADIEKWYA